MLLLNDILKYRGLAVKDLCRGRFICEHVNCNGGKLSVEIPRFSNPSSNNYFVAELVEESSKEKRKSLFVEGVLIELSYLMDLTFYHLIDRPGDHRLVISFVRRDIRDMRLFASNDRLAACDELPR